MNLGMLAGLDIIVVENDDPDMEDLGPNEVGIRGRRLFVRKELWARIEPELRKHTITQPERNMTARF